MNQEKPALLCLDDEINNLDALERIFRITLSGKLEEQHEQWCNQQHQNGENYGDEPLLNRMSQHGAVSIPTAVTAHMIICMSQALPNTWQL